MADERITSPEVFEAMDFLIKAQDTDVPRLPEAVFVGKYLPILADTHSGKADLSQWLDVCGNGYRPVDVVRGDVVLFRVPPILKRYATPGMRRGMSIGEILAQAQAHSDLLPHLGKNYMESKLSEKIEHQSPEVNDLHVWNDILQRYGYPLIETALEASAPAAAKPVEEKPLFSGEFDDF